MITSKLLYIAGGIVIILIFLCGMFVGKKIWQCPELPENYQDSLAISKRIQDSLRLRFDSIEGDNQYLHQDIDNLTGQVVYFRNRYINNLNNLNAELRIIRNFSDDQLYQYFSSADTSGLSGQ